MRSRIPKSPLTAHPSGRWCKKRKGKQHYFGPLDNWQGALERFKHDWPYIVDGRTPPPVDTQAGVRLADLANEFLNSKHNRLDNGELSGMPQPTK